MQTDIEKTLGLLVAQRAHLAILLGLESATYTLLQLARLGGSLNLYYGCAALFQRVDDGIVALGGKSASPLGMMLDATTGEVYDLRDLAEEARSVWESGDDGARLRLHHRVLKRLIAITQTRIDATGDYNNAVPDRASLEERSFMLDPEGDRLSIATYRRMLREIDAALNEHEGGEEWKKHGPQNEE